MEILLIIAIGIGFTVFISWIWGKSYKQEYKTK